MGIGRRAFLKHVGAALAGFSIDPWQSTVAASDVYLNRKLGILFKKPSEWGFLGVRDFGALKDKQILGNGLNDCKEEVWEDLGDPICMATKFPQQTNENRRLFSPTVSLHITPMEELAEFGAKDMDDLRQMSERGTAVLLERFRVLRRFSPYELSGCIFHEYHSEYLFQHVELEVPLMAELRSLKTEHHGFYYEFNWHECAAQHQSAGREYEAFKHSIRLI